MSDFFSEYAFGNVWKVPKPPFNEFSLISKHQQFVKPIYPAALVLPLDITKHDQHEAAFAEVLKVYGHIDILVLNSGIYENTYPRTDECELLV